MENIKQLHVSSLAIEIDQDFGHGLWNTESKMYNFASLRIMWEIWKDPTSTEN